MHSIKRFLATVLPLGITAQTWPNHVTDEIEDLMFLNTGYRAKNFAGPVTPCEFTGGRVTAAEWLRTAFHDMANGDAHAGQGGLDASIVYELGFSDNAGKAFNETLLAFEPFYSPSTSMSDLLALGTYTGVRACGGPAVALRFGRTDATTAGSTGIPAPQNAISIFRNQFYRMGYTTDQAMITFVACGHTMGSVKSATQPLIVAPGTAPPYGSMPMDSSPASFDNKIATEYVSNSTTNPLVYGLSERYRRNSDKVVFQSDNNVTIGALTDPNVFAQQCKQVFEQMTEVVPSTVQLTSSTLKPYECKPHDIRLYLVDGGKLKFEGEIRIRTTNRPTSSMSSVGLLYTTRSGDSCPSCTSTTTFSGSANGYDDSFAFYSFSTTISAETSISSFMVQVTHSDGSTETFDNGGTGFVIEDELLLQTPQTCASSPSSLTVMAAVRGSNVPSANAITKRYDGRYIRPIFNTVTSSMTKTNSSIGPYTLFSVTMSLNASQVTAGSRFNITLPDSSVTYHDLLSLPGSCAPAPTSTSSQFTSLGCVTDSVSSRTLTGAQTYDNTATTIESCAKFCKSWKYFGLEYSSECYCANSLASTSTSASSGCNMPCSGDRSQTCGGAGFLNLYSNPVSNLPASYSVGAYAFVGCFTDSQAVRTLSGARHNDGAMTVELCAQYCSEDGYSSFGTEYGAECYCSSSVASEATETDIWECNMPCGGNSAQACGAANRLSLYSATNTTSTAARMRKRQHLHQHLHKFDS